MYAHNVNEKQQVIKINTHKKLRTSEDNEKKSSAQIPFSKQETVFSYKAHQKNKNKKWKK